MAQNSSEKTKKEEKAMLTVISTHLKEKEALEILRLHQKRKELPQ